MAFGSKRGIGFMTAVATAFATPLLACPVCFGNVNSLQTKGMQAGILALLGVTAAILAGFAGFFFIYLRRRIRLFEQSGAVHERAHGGSY
jgi:hypothetical protein